MRRRIVCETAVTWAMPNRSRTFGWKKCESLKRRHVCDSMFFTLIDRRRNRVLAEGGDLASPFGPARVGVLPHHRHHRMSISGKNVRSAVFLIDVMPSTK